MVLPSQILSLLLLWMEDICGVIKIHQVRLDQHAKGFGGTSCAPAAIALMSDNSLKVSRMLIHTVLTEECRRY